MTALAEHLTERHAAGAYSGPGDLGAAPAAVPGPVLDGDRTGAVRDRSRAVRSWPLLLLAFPAAAEVWSGWVGIAQKTGFGRVSPLPGIWSSLHLDTTITLPIGVEAYAAYALRAWLATEPWISPRTRRFAKWSAICSFAARHGRPGRLPPPGPGRRGPRAVGHHHRRVLPAGPGPGHGDRAGPHAPRRRLGRGDLGRPVRWTSRRPVPRVVRRGKASGPGPRDQDHGPDQSPRENQQAPAPTRPGRTARPRRGPDSRSPAPE